MLSIGEYVDLPRLPSVCSGVVGVVRYQKPFSCQKDKGNTVT